MVDQLDQRPVAIEEDGTPPRYQAWLYKDGKPLPPAAGSVEVRLKRLGNIAELASFFQVVDEAQRAATLTPPPAGSPAPPPKPAIRIACNRALPSCRAAMSSGDFASA